MWELSIAIANKKQHTAKRVVKARWINSLRWLLYMGYTLTYTSHSMLFVFIVIYKITIYIEKLALTSRESLYLTFVSSLSVKLHTTFIIHISYFVVAFWPILFPSPLFPCFFPFHLSVVTSLWEAFSVFAAICEVVYFFVCLCVVFYVKIFSHQTTQT